MLNVVEPLREGLVASYVCMSKYCDKEYKESNTQYLCLNDWYTLHVWQKFTNLMKKKKKNEKKQQNKKRARLHARKRRPGTNFPKIVKYKSPSRSKLSNLSLSLRESVKICSWNLPSFFDCFLTVDEHLENPTTINLSRFGEFHKQSR